MPVFQFNPPERFVAGTVGQPGERTFFLQAVGEGRITSVALEKAQVEALASRVEELLEEVNRRFGAQTDEVVPPEDEGPLEQPIEEDFRVGTLALAWDAEAARVIIEAQEIDESAGEALGDTGPVPLAKLCPQRHGTDGMFVALLRIG